MNASKIPKEIIRSITTTDDNVEFICDNYRIVFEAIGDCCSYSYLRYYTSMLLGIGKILDHVNQEVIDTDALPDYIDSDGHGSSYSYHKYEFVYTDGSMTTLELVNESNGWYDGWLDCRIISLPMNNAAPMIE